MLDPPTPGDPEEDAVAPFAVSLAPFTPPPPPAA